MARRRTRKWSILFALVGLLLLFTLLKNPVISLSLGIAAVLGLLAYGLYSYHRLKSILAIRDLGQLSHRQFEVFWATFFEQRGYDTTLTPQTRDQGADVIIEKAGVRTAIQTKQYTGAVGNDAVQQVVAAKGFYNCQRAMCITTSVYTASAKDLAQANGVELWDGQRVAAEIAELPVMLKKIGLTSSMMNAIPRWGYVALGIILFVSATAFSYNIFSGDPSPPRTSPIPVKNNNDTAPQPQQETPITNQPTASPPQLRPDTSNDRQTKLAALDDRINKIDAEIAATQADMSKTRTLIDGQRAQIEGYQQARDVLYNQQPNPTTSAQMRQLNQKVIEANSEIARLNGVLASQQGRLNELNAQKRNLLQQKRQLQN